MWKKRKEGCQLTSAKEEGFVGIGENRGSSSTQGVRGGVILQSMS